MQRRLSFAMAVLATLLTTLLTPVAALAQSKTLRIVPHTNITILDPIWSSAFVTRNHGYMVYDTLFGTDAEGRIKPQIGSGGRTGVLEYPQTMTDSSGQPPGTGNPCPPI